MRSRFRLVALGSSALLGVMVFSFVWAHDTAPGGGSHVGAAASTEAAFLAENDAAMTKMMADMELRPSGDVDRDFVAMMAPHHQGAIDMAQALLRHGKNEQLRRLAQEIIITQQQEIVAMRLAIGATPPQPAVSAAPHPHTMHKN